MSDLPGRSWAAPATATRRSGIDTDVRDEIARNRLRAALRLLFDAGRADELVTRSERQVSVDERQALLARMAQRDLQWTRFMAHLPRRQRQPVGTEAPHAQPLAGVARVSPAAAVAYAIFLAGLRSRDRLSDAIGLSEDELGERLTTARRALDPLIDPCPTQRAIIGRVGERVDRDDDWLALLAHARICDNCRAALERSRALDAELAAEIERTAAALPPLPPGSQTRSMVVVERARGLTLGLLIVVTVVATGVLVSERTGPAHTPVPLLAVTGAETETPLDGWLVYMAQQGGVEAYHLGTHERRPLPALSSEMWWQPSIAPDYRSFATYAATDVPDQAAIEVRALDGVLLRRVEWDNIVVQRTPSGWLDATTLLILQTPSFGLGDTQETYSLRAMVESQLIALDVESGTERVLMQGDVVGAVPSPDGTMVVIWTSYDFESPGRTVELRAVDDARLGLPLARVENRVTSGVLWAKDSSRFYVSVITDEVLRADSTAASAGWNGDQWGFERQALVAFDRAGTPTTLVTPEPHVSLNPVTTSPDGQYVVYGTALASNPREAGSFDLQWGYWRIATAGGSAISLGDDLGSGWLQGAVWTPDGSTMLVTFMPRADELLANPEFRRDAFGQALVAFGPSWEPRLVSAQMSGTGVIALLPSDALPAAPAPATEPLAGEASDPLAVVFSGGPLQLTAESDVSADGSTALLWNPEVNRPVIVSLDRPDRRPRRLASAPTDLSWLDVETVAIGVILAQAGQADHAQSWLSFFAGHHDPRFTVWYDFLRFDPAGISTEPSRYYAQPVMSPNSKVLAFLVVDAQRGSVSVWVAGWQTPPQEVLMTMLPAGRLLDALPALFWADDSSLIVTRPDDWADGLPRQVILERIDIVEGSIPTVTRLTTIEGRNIDRGVVLTEIVLSPDATQVAYRLRHYREPATDRGRSDTLHVMSVNDVSRAREIVDGSPGDGLTWSPDGSLLAAGFERRIVLFDPNGGRPEYVTPDDARASYPIWVDEHTLWFARDADGSGDTIWSVAVR